MSQDSTHQEPESESEADERLTSRDLFARLPQTADGKPIFLGDTIYAFNGDESYWGPHAILTQTVHQMALGATFDDYAGTFTVVGDDWEGGNLDCYASRENVPIDRANDQGDAAADGAPPRQ